MDPSNKIHEVDETNNYRSYNPNVAPFPQPAGYCKVANPNGMQQRIRRYGQRYAWRRDLSMPGAALKARHAQKDRRHFYPRPDAKAADGLWLYGLHAVRAALANPRRKLKRAILTARAAEEIGAKLLGRVRHEIADGDAVARLLPAGAVHQGVAL